MKRTGFKLAAPLRFAALTILLAGLVTIATGQPSQPNPWAAPTKVTSTESQTSSAERTASSDSSGAVPARDPSVVENKMFDEVAGKLDRGGSFYMIVNLDNAVLGFIDRVEPALQGFGGAEVAMLGPMARAVVKSLGLQQLGAYGSSVVRLKDSDLLRTRTYLRLKEKTGLFSLCAGNPRDLTFAQAIPQDAAIAIVENVDLPKIFDLVKQVAAGIAGAAGEGMIETGLAEARKQSGVDFKELIGTLGDELALYLRASDTETMDIGDVKLPRISGALMLKVTDNTIYKTVLDLAEKKGAQLKESTDGPEGYKIITFPVPENPFGLAPVLAQGPERLIIASDPKELAASAKAAESAGKIDFRSSDEFAKLAAALPDGISAKSSNGIAFLSGRVSQKVVRVIREAIEKQGSNDKGAEAVLKMLPSGSAAVGALSIWVNDEHGSQSVQVGGEMQLPSATAAVAGAGIGTAIAVPAFIRARQNAAGQAVKAETKSAVSSETVPAETGASSVSGTHAELCRQNLNKIDGAKEQWALEHKKSNGAAVTWEDLLHPDGNPGYLRSMPQCPDGGTYTLNPIGKNPTCSLAKTGKGNELQHYIP